MTDRSLKFPEGFLWGAATSSHQNEGNNTNNDFWEWEKTPGHVVDGTDSGLACDWWNRAEEDFDRAADLHMNTLRISLEWSRIEPEPGKWDIEAIERYRAMLQGLNDRGLRPMVTLHHFTNPLWVAEKGGWTDPRIVTWFSNYARMAVDSFSDLCNFWGTINEPNVYAAYSYALGKWSPGKQDVSAATRVMRNMSSAHAAAYHVIKTAQPEAIVGPVQHVVLFDPADENSFLSKWVARMRMSFFTWRTLEAVTQGRFKFPLGLGFQKAFLHDTNDYIGLNYYGRHLLRFSLQRAGELFAEEVDADPDVAWPLPWTDREICPEGLYDLIMETHRRFQKPIYILENGFAEENDRQRPAFILAHTAAVWKAIQDGADVRGFYYWTLVDNYEWVEGWTTPFGLIHLDPETQQRTLRDSARLYGKIAESNSITEETVAEYAPQLSETIFH
jgi:beta-glucosidase